MSPRQMLCGAAMLAAAMGCKVRTRETDNSLPATGEVPNVTGTYVAADSGTTLGKKWCYSGALVLDSTQHFGSVLTMCSDDGDPVTEHLKGTYRLKSLTARVGGVRVLKRLDVILNQDGRGKSHTLRYVAGGLKFDEPWWLGAGLRALEIPDPVLKRVDDAMASDSAGTASSTLAVATAPARGGPAAKKSPTRAGAAK